MNKQFFALIIIFSLITSTFTSVKCNSQYYCDDGYRCCEKSSGGYSCCKSSTKCSSDGQKCYSSSLTPNVYGMAMTPATPAHELQTNE